MRIVAMLLFFCGLLCADPTLPEKVELQPGRLGWVSVETKSVEAVYWINPNADLDLIPVENGRKAILSSAKTGAYRIYVYTTLNGKATQAKETVVWVGKQPTPPVPPTPDPTPPTPDPTPDPVTPPPIPEPGFRVLIVYRDKDVANKMPKEQSAILFAQEVREYLDKKCVVGTDGKTPERRIWPEGVDTQFAPPIWQKAIARERKSLPWIVVSNGKTGFEGPLPANIPDTMKLLKKYGGE